MTSRHYTESATPDSSKRYARDLSDQEFERIAPLVAQKEGSGKKRTVDIREMYLLKKPGPTGRASHQTVAHIRVY
jgi:hypothetical protein